MEIQDYIEKFTSDVYAEADANQISVEEAFLINVADNLIESEVISKFIPEYFTKAGRYNRKIEFNGYSHEKADGTFNLFVVDNLDEIENALTNTLLDSLIKRAEELVYCAIESKFVDWEESSAGYEVASQIHRLYQNRERMDTDFDLRKIRIFVLTNKIISKRFKNIKRDTIYNIPVEFSVYDSSKLFDMAKVGFEKEPVDIFFEDYSIPGIYATKCISKSDEFESYLAAIPGEVLANIYLENGTQVLEGNVRAFLSTRGKVNKGIRKTIITEPEKFFVLNNGITVTSTGIEVDNTKEGFLITKIGDLQIVNGGQTTASLANAIIKDKADLSKVRVMVKLTVLSNQDIAIKLVPEISRASNSQNKVDEADFFSNHPFHIKIQELSERNMAPAVDGNQYQTEWFYERARGQYTVAQMKLTPSESKAWQKKHPKSQMIKKTDLAKFVMTYEGFPQEASRGSQAVMKKFSTIIQGPNGDDGLWANNSSEINGAYFRDLISKAIIFKETEKLVSSLEWYKEIKSYRANIVAYSIAVLSHYAKMKKKSIDLKRVWNNQHMYDHLESQLKVTTKEIYEFLVSEERLTQNVTEWAKKEECWKRAQKKKWTILDKFETSLVEIVKEKKSEVTEAKVDSMHFVVSETNLDFWFSLKDWGMKHLYLNPKDEGFIDIAISIHERGRLPASDKSYSEILRVYNYLVSKGFEHKKLAYL